MHKSRRKLRGTLDTQTFVLDMLKSILAWKPAITWHLRNHFWGQNWKLGEGWWENESLDWFAPGVSFWLKFLRLNLQMFFFLILFSALDLVLNQSSWQHQAPHWCHYECHCHVSPGYHWDLHSSWFHYWHLWPFSVEPHEQLRDVSSDTTCSSLPFHTRCRRHPATGCVHWQCVALGWSCCWMFSSSTRRPWAACSATCSWDVSGGGCSGSSCSPRTPRQAGGRAPGTWQGLEIQQSRKTASEKTHQGGFWLDALDSRLQSLWLGDKGRAE